MITVAAAVEKIVTDDGFVREAMQRGILNISAYADTITQKLKKIDYLRDVQIQQPRERHVIAC